MNTVRDKTFPINTPLVSTSKPKSRKKLHGHPEDVPEGRKEESGS